MTYEAPIEPLDAAILFGSFLENYGDHHDWCVVKHRNNYAKGLYPDCTCGFLSALDAVAGFHRYLKTGTPEAVARTTRFTNEEAR